MWFVVSGARFVVFVVVVAVCCALTVCCLLCVRCFFLSLFVVWLFVAPCALVCLVGVRCLL